MTYIRDDLSLAYKLWTEIYNAAQTQLEKDASVFHLYQIKFEMDKQLLEKKVRLYKDRFGRYPFELNQLVRSGFIKEIPDDFFGEDYIYNSKTGGVRAKRVFKWKKLH